MSGPATTSRSLCLPERRWLTGLFLLFLLVRCGALWHFWPGLHSDPDAYLGIARQIAAGHGMTAPESDRPTAFRPPLYPLLLAPIAQESQILARAWLHLALAGFTWLAMVRLGCNLGLSVFQIGIASLIFTFDPLSLRYIALPMTETLCTCLATLLLMLLTLPPFQIQSALNQKKSLQPPDADASGRRSLCRRQDRRNILTGIVFGLTVLSRPTFWLFGIIAGVWWFIQQQFIRSPFTSLPERTSVLRTSCMVLMGTACLVVPWMIRNQLVMGSPILMTTHGGYTLLLGNNPAFYQEVVSQPGGTIWDGSHGEGQEGWWKTIQQQIDKKQIHGEVAVDRWMTQLAKRSITSHPSLFLKACLLKFCWFWNIAPHGPEAAHLPRTILWEIRIFYSLFWLSAGLGLLRLWRQSLRKSTAAHPSNRQNFTETQTFSGSLTREDLQRWHTLVLLILSLSAPHLLYWSDARMRAPLVPALALLAASIWTWTPWRPLPRKK